VSEIQFLSGDVAGTQKVTFRSKTEKHSKDDLVKSLGDKATTYVVKEVKKAESGASPPQ
jgi:hypothetical protein